MNISLTQELENRVKARVKSGMYNNASEVIREALRFWELNEEWIKQERLRGLLRAGIGQMERGEYTAINSEDELDALFNNIRESATK